MEEVLTHIAAQLDIPEYLFEKVTDRYESLSRWLERVDSTVKCHEPKIYVQGSFSLGTMIRPLSDRDEFDIDCVCTLDLSPVEVTQRQVKESVGKEVCGYVSSHNFKSEAVEWEKCWTLEYADESYTFKMDVVPTIPDVQSRERLFKEANLDQSIASTAVLVTDKKSKSYNMISRDWTRGNPKGYLEWFKSRMLVRLHELKAARARGGTVALAAEEIPDYEIKTPLQQSIQLLKRHRDSFFQSRKPRPSSIVLTTLAARAYGNESTLVKSMQQIIAGMGTFIGQRGGVWWVENPVDPTENFADSWEGDPSKADTFFEWLEALKEDWSNFCQASPENRLILLESRFGSTITKRAYASVEGLEKPVIALSSFPARNTQFDVPQRKTPPWRIIPSASVSVDGRYSRNKTTGSWVSFQSDSPPLDKELSLRFFAETDALPPYDVYWQVVNTGEEAERLQQLRGEFRKASTYGAGGLQSTSVKTMRDECTRYKGMHWVECFIVKSGICIARSGPFVVNVK
jgi:hypothetical protein